MLLVVRRARNAGNNSENCAEPIICAVNRVRHPTTAPAMPAFAFQNCVRAPIWVRRRHRIQGAGMRFFFERARAQEFLHIGFTGERAITLFAKFRFVFFFGRLHAANGDVGARHAVPPTIEPARNRTSRTGGSAPRSFSFCSQRCAWRSSASAMRSKIPRRFSLGSRDARSR